MAVILLTFVAFLWIVHLFTRYIDYAPYLAVDDSEANISVAIANIPRYGFPASPVARFEGWRLDSMLNYGPAAFLIGAALDWLFGSSYAVLRWLHLLCMTAVGILGFWTFRRVSVAACCAFAFLLMYLFSVAQWPMFRPDPATALSGAAAIASLTWALRTGSFAAWWTAAFAATTAATTHQIAWAAPVVAGAVWLGSLWVNRWRDFVRHLLAFGSGGLVALVVYLVAIGFRLKTLLVLWQSYATLTRDIVGSKSGLDLLQTHLQFAWGSVNSVVLWILFGGCILGLILLGEAVIKKRRHAVALLLPPLLLGGAYQLSLALYPNFHTGYAIFIHVSTLWLAMASLALAIERVGSIKPSGPVVEIISRIGLAACIAWPGLGSLKAGNPWLRSAANSVSIHDYLHETLGMIPERARAWGDVYFGLETGTRYELVHPFSGAALLASASKSERSGLRPDFLLLNREADRLLRDLGRGGEIWTGMLADFPYRPFAIVDAPPYGSTSLFSVQDTADRLPAIAVYDERARVWTRQLGERIDLLAIGAKTAPPVRLVISYLGKALAPLDAKKSVRTELPSGIFLVKFDIESGSASPFGVMVATKGAQAALSEMDSGLGVPISPYFVRRGHAYMVLHHAGGPIFFSQFGDDPGANFSVTGLWPVVGPRHGFPLSAIKDWTIEASGGTVTFDGDTLHVNGDKSKYGYQLRSPPMLVEAGAEYEITLGLTVLDGAVSIGVLNKNGQAWLTSPIDGRAIKFIADRTGEASIVIANNSETQPNNSRFEVSGGTISRIDNSYVDQLAKCYAPSATYATRVYHWLRGDAVANCVE